MNRVHVDATPHGQRRQLAEHLSHGRHRDVGDLREDARHQCRQSRVLGLQRRQHHAGGQRDGRVQQLDRVERRLVPSSWRCATPRRRSASPRAERSAAPAAASARRLRATAGAAHGWRRGRRRRRRDCDGGPGGRRRDRGEGRGDSIGEVTLTRRLGRSPSRRQPVQSLREKRDERRLSARTTGFFSVLWSALWRSSSVCTLLHTLSSSLLRVNGDERTHLVQRRNAGTMAPPPMEQHWSWKEEQESSSVDITSPSDLVNRVSSDSTSSCRQTAPPHPPSAPRRSEARSSRRSRVPPARER